jgi:hypothetical protein
MAEKIKEGVDEAGAEGILYQVRQRHATDTATAHVGHN